MLTVERVELAKEVLNKLDSTLEYGGIWAISPKLFTVVGFKVYSNGIMKTKFITCETNA